VRRKKTRRTPYLAYDDRGRLIGLNATNHTETRAISLAYDAQGQVAEITAAR
jgi:YD repeat-containing protein